MKADPKTPDEILANAQETLRAIDQLKQCPEFVGFYQSFLRARRDAFDRAALHTAGLTLEQREIQRLLGREYDELIDKALDNAASMARKAIAQGGKL